MNVSDQKKVSLGMQLARRALAVVKEEARAADHVVIVIACDRSAHAILPAIAATADAEDARQVIAACYSYLVEQDAEPSLQITEPSGDA